MRRRRPSPHSRPSLRNSQGMTLIELTIVLVIVSLIATIAMPELLNSLDRGRQTSTVSDLRILGDGLERYAADHYGYPVVDDMAKLRTELQPSYIKKVPLEDGWGHPFVFQADKAGSTYTLLSPGKDGKIQKADDRIEITHDFNADIVCVDGVLVQRPQGQQE